MQRRWTKTNRIMKMEEEEEVLRAIGRFSDRASIALFSNLLPFVAFVMSGQSSMQTISLSFFLSVVLFLSHNLSFSSLLLLFTNRLSCALKHVSSIVILTILIFHTHLQYTQDLKTSVRKSYCMIASTFMHHEACFKWVQYNREKKNKI